VTRRQTPQIEYLIAGGSFVRPLFDRCSRKRPFARVAFADAWCGPQPALFLTLQHPVDKRPKIHLDGVEFTLKYRDRARKVVDKLGTGLVNLDHCRVALIRRGTGALANLRDIGDRWPRLGDLTSGLTGIAASVGLRDAPIS